MTNMNHFEDPAVYGLTDQDGRVFYVGKTNVNALNRWWEHRYRARINYPAPLYKRWNEIGMELVGFTVLQNLTPEDDAHVVDLYWIEKLRAAGNDLANQLGANRNPFAWSEASKEKVSRSNKGKDTWIKGKTGKAAGWSDERKQIASDRAAAARATRAPNHGSRTEYVKYKCRCDVCRAGYSTIQANDRVRTGRKRSKERT